MENEIKTNEKYKDRLFNFIFSQKEATLSLYNALNGTAYTNPDDIEINTIENFLYMGAKNDVSFLLGSVLNLYEHQSTVNPNMPLRGFLYLSKHYMKMLEGKVDIYSSKLIPIPTPRFIVFYNGSTEEEEMKLVKMSDAFQGKAAYGPAIECTAVLLNINYGYNKDLMEKCKRLNDYALLIHRVRENVKAGMTRDEAIDAAVDECIKDGILADILTAHRGEATYMILEEYDEELHINNEKQISYEDGLERGIEQGIEQGIERSISSMLSKKYSPEEISEILDIDLEKVKSIESKLLAMK